MPDPIITTAKALDLSPRFKFNTTVVASPAAGSETIIASVQLGYLESFALGAVVFCQCSFTAGTNGVTAQLKIRQTNVSGTVVATGAAATVVAANVYTQSLWGLDTSPAAGQVYKVTLTVGSGSAASTVSQLLIGAIAV